MVVLVFNDVSILDSDSFASVFVVDGTSECVESIESDLLDVPT